MKTRLIFLTVVVSLFSTVTLFGQSGLMREIYPLLNELRETNQLKASGNQSKAPGDTLWYEDFGNGFTTNGWISTDASNNGLNWIYTTNAPGGQYSTSIPALVSATSANGFASLPSDLYNTPTPNGGFLLMDSYLQTGPISIAPRASVEVRWTQSQRYCCSSTEQLELQVSTNGVNWVSFDAKFGRQANSAVVENAQMDISSIASNQSTIYLRFYQTSSHYYWMIDDIAILESGNAQVEVTESYLLDQQNLQTYYSHYPCSNPPIFTPAGVIENPTGNNVTNIRLSSAIVSSGNTSYLGTSLVNGVIAPFQSSSFQMTSAYNNSGLIGDYSVLYKGLGDSTVISPSNTMISFSVSDTIFARDLNNPSGAISPSDYPGGFSLNSHLGVFYELKNPSFISSISFYVANNTDNVGMTVKGELFTPDTTSFNVGISVASSQNYTIDSADLGSWISLSIGQPNQSTPAGLYSATIVQVSRSAPTNSLLIGRDASAELLAPFGSTFVSSVYLNASAGYGLILALPMIRLNFKSSGGCNTVGIKDANVENNQINVFPNPSSGLVNIQFPINHQLEQIEVYAANGKRVMTTLVANQSIQQLIDLSQYKNGIYFLRFISIDGVSTQKVVID